MFHRIRIKDPGGGPDIVRDSPDDGGGPFGDVDAMVILHRRVAVAMVMTAVPVALVAMHHRSKPERRRAAHYRRERLASAEAAQEGPSGRETQDTREGTRV